MGTEDRARFEVRRWFREISVSGPPIGDGRRAYAGKLSNLIKANQF
jgi:hypothetical protein